MRSRVLIQYGFLSEVLAALATLVGLFSCMNTNVLNNKKINEK
jgi:hypothetical protein